MDRALSPLEHDALDFLVRRGGSVLATGFTEKTEKDLHGFRVPGLSVYRTLERDGLCFLTEEDLLFPDEPELGTFTPSVEVTAAGRAALRATEALEAARRKQEQQRAAAVRKRPKHG